MKRILEVCLTDLFPELFKFYRTKERFPHHFECGDGWFPLIYTWASAVTSILCYEKMHGMRVFCAKEKFGTLDIQSTFDKDHNISEEVLKKLRYIKWGIGYASSVICEKCGHPGYLRSGGWRRCLCTRCESEYQAAMNAGDPGWDTPDHTDVEELLKIVFKEELI